MNQSIPGLGRPKDVEQTGELPKPNTPAENAKQLEEQGLKADTTTPVTDTAPEQGFRPVQYSSHPIQRYTAGRFRFENSVLTLNNQDDVDEFEKSLAGMPEAERHKIKKIDIQAAERLIERMRAQQPGAATQGVDSATGDRAGGPKIGVGDLVRDQPKAGEPTPDA